MLSNVSELLSPLRVDFHLFLMPYLVSSLQNFQTFLKILQVYFLIITCLLEMSLKSEVEPFFQTNVLMDVV